MNDQGKWLDVDSIRTDGGTQSRAALNEEQVGLYAEAMAEGAAFPAIVVFHDGSAHWLADGFHRVFAARRAHMPKLLADVRPGTREDALWFALGSNTANGVARTRGDIKHAVLLALRTWPEKTQAEIARQVGCVQSFVAKVKCAVITSDNTAMPKIRTDSIGRDQPTSKPRKPREDQVHQSESRQAGSKSARVEKIAALAAQGFRAQQIATSIGLSEDNVRRYAKEAEITLPDAAIGKTRRIDSRRVIEQTVLSIESAAQTVNTIKVDLSSITKEEAAEMADAVAEALRIYRLFHNKLKEYANG